MYKLANSKKYIPTLEENGFEIIKLREPLSFLRIVRPSEMPEGYPAIPETKAPLAVAVLHEINEEDPILDFRNETNPIIAKYQDGIKKILGLTDANSYCPE